jgi:putative radical SAM enzyme (TIGR03279 family)
VLSSTRSTIKPATVTRVLPNSIAEELGFEPGDRLVLINGTAPRDLIDYQFLCADDVLTLEVEDGEGVRHQVELEKEYDEDLGLEFDSALFDGLIQCNNGCSFCFIDQQPGGLRGTLYLKDDDYRLSFLYGSYLTLTNLPAQEFERIAQLRLSPLYVSVHATEPDLRAKLLKNPRGRLLLEQLSWFKQHGLEIHAQVVLCPGLNDGEQLDRTLTDLASFYPTVRSAAVVPIGLTQYRPADDDMVSVTRAKAEEIIEQVLPYQKRYKKQLGTSFSWLSDEWFLLAGRPLPPRKHYEDFPQLGNGVGSLRKFVHEFQTASTALPKSLSDKRHYTWVVGNAVKEAFAPIAERFNQVEGLTISLAAIPSLFWGQQVSVTGLLTGQDILEGLKGRDLGDALLLPSLTLKDGREFLDSMTVDALAQSLEIPVLVVPSSAQALVESINRTLPRGIEVVFG